MDLNNLDFNNIGAWPTPLKLALIGVAMAAIGGATYYFVIEDQWKKLKQLQTREGELRKDFQEKQAKAVNLEAYKQQLADMNVSFSAMLKQLPNKAEVADLLVDISQSGLGSGLEFELFQPGGENPQGFYAELPIKLRVTGYYHQLGDFVSQVAALPRIVTVHDVDIKPEAKAAAAQSKDKKAAEPQAIKLVMEATAKTYRYLEGEQK